MPDQNWEFFVPDSATKNQILSDYRVLAVSREGLQHVFRGAFDDEATLLSIGDRLAYREVVMFTNLIISVNYQSEEIRVEWFDGDMAKKISEDDILTLQDWENKAVSYWKMAISFIRWSTIPDEPDESVQTDIFAGSDDFFKRACKTHYGQEARS